MAKVKVNLFLNKCLKKTDMTFKDLSSLISYDSLNYCCEWKASISNNNFVDSL